MSSKANEKQVGGSHYKSQYQHWDFIQDADLSYLEAQVVKYITRWRDKNGKQDLEKALHFLEKLHEERKTQLGCITHYVKANNLSETERVAIQHVIFGRYQEARNSVCSLMDFEKAAEPSPDYVCQDPDLKKPTVGEVMVSQPGYPDEQIQTYEWSCRHCHDKITVRQSARGQTKLQDFIKQHLESCYAEAASQPKR